MAFSSKTERLVTQEGNRIIIAPREQTLDDVPALFAQLNPHFDGSCPEFIASEREG